MSTHDDAPRVVQNERDQPVELYVEGRVVHLGPRERVELGAAALRAPQVRLMVERHVLVVEPLAEEAPRVETEEDEQPAEETEEN